MPRSKRTPLTEAALSDKTARHRAALNGRPRNDAEAQRCQKLMETCLRDYRCGRNGKAQALTDSIAAQLPTLDRVLTPLGQAHYAPVDTTPDGEARSPLDACAVAAANVRRAIGAGDMEGVRCYLNVLRIRLGR